MSIEMLLAYALVLSVLGLLVYIGFVVGLNFALSRSRILYETLEKLRGEKDARKKSRK